MPSQPEMPDHADPTTAAANRGARQPVMPESAPQPGERRIYIARHGERADIANPDWLHTAEAPYNPPLTPTGHAQAAHLAKRLAKAQLQVVVSSPFLRCVQTANRVADAIDLPILIERGAGEMLSADWYPADPRDWTLNDLKADFPRIDTAYTSRVDPVYPEVWESCRTRAAETMCRLVEHLTGNFLVVVHGATLNSMTWGLVDGYPTTKGGYCCLLMLQSLDGGPWRIAHAGDPDQDA